MGQRGGVPGVEGAATPATGALRQQILGPFLHKVPRVGRKRVTMGYRVGVALVALGMALLPLCYVGLIALVGVGIYFHATANLALFQESSSAVRMVALYVAPIALGLGLIMFLLKPLFARPVGQRGRYAVRPEDEPLLFEFVASVSDAVGAPRPVRIDLVMEVNAGASFERGLLSFWNNNLVLIIGMPLLTGLTTRQLAGVLAHEFGHFSQGTGMRLSYLINRINAWLHRSVYERDSWDVWLAERSSSAGLFRPFFGALRFAVWCTRWVLWVFMMVGHAMSCVLLRQMEYDADRSEARLAGSEVFNDTCWQMRLMGVATQFTFGQLQMAWHEQRLVDNFPSLIAFNACDLPPSVLEKVRQAVSRSKTAWHDTHPADRARMQRVAREPAPGVYHQSFASTLLLRNFDERARRMSLSLYREILGDGVSQRNLVPLKTLLEEERTRRKEQKAGARFLQHAFSHGFPLLFAERQLDVPKDPSALRTTLRETRAQLAGMLSEVPEAVRAFEEADEGVAVLRVLQALRGYRVNISHFKTKSVKIPRAEDIPHRILELAEEREVALVVLEHFRALTYRRILCALRLLHHPPVYQKIGWGIPLIDEAEKALIGPRVFSRYFDVINSLSEAQLTLDVYMRADHSGRLINEVMRQLQRLAGEIHEGLGQLQGALGDCEYPYLHASGKVSVGQYAIPHIPPMRDLFNLSATASDSLHKIGYYYARSLFRVCDLAEQVEQALGMEPFPDPPEKVAEGDDVD